MKATIIIYLDDGKEIALTLDQAIELRDKLNTLAPRKESDGLDEFRRIADHYRHNPTTPPPLWLRDKVYMDR